MDSLTDRLSDVLGSIGHFQSELALIAGIIVFILVDLTVKVRYILPALGILLSGIILYLDIFYRVGEGGVLPLFHGMILRDPASDAWKIILDLATVLTMVMAVRSRPFREKGESYPLIFTILLGGHLLAMASNLLIMYMAVEIISISSYALTLFSFNKKGSEAAVKYLLFGAVASALMLYGISWVFTFTGSLNFTLPEFPEALFKTGAIPLSIGMALVLTGFLFKIAAVPLHIWSPDVYTVAPTSVVAFFSTVPKLAGFAILTKWFLIMNLFGLGPVRWVDVLSIIAMITLVIGNFAALRQSNVKRLMAYSSIAHTGFLLIPVVSLSEQASRNLYFYAVIYVLMNLAVFALVQFLEYKEGISKAEEYKGLMKSYPLIGILFIVLMISLTGLPPTAGFTAKLLIFTSLWEAWDHSQSPWLLYLFIFGLLNTVVSLFYYLKIPFFMIFRNYTGQRSSHDQKYPAWENYFGLIMVLAVITLFFKPEWLMNVINNISFAF